MFFYLILQRHFLNRNQITNPPSTTTATEPIIIPAIAFSESPLLCYTGAINNPHFLHFTGLVSSGNSLSGVCSSKLNLLLQVEQVSQCPVLSFPPYFVILCATISPYAFFQPSQIAFFVHVAIPPKQLAVWVWLLSVLQVRVCVPLSLLTHSLQSCI